MTGIMEYQRIPRSTTLDKPLQRHSYVLLGWTPQRIAFIFGEHEDGGLGELEAIGQQELHALGVVDAALELVPGVPVRDAAYQGSLRAVGRRRGPRRPVGRRRPLRRIVLGEVMVVVEGGGGGGGGVGGGGRQGARIGDEGDGVAEGAADGGGTRWQLQRSAAIGAVDQQHYDRLACSERGEEMVLCNGQRWWEE